MEQSSYFSWFIVVFIIFYLAKIEKDNQKKLFYHLLTTLLFLSMAFLAFGVQIIVYDSSLGQFVTYNEASYTLQPFLIFGIMLIFAIDSGFSFMLSIGEEWARLKNGREMKRNY